MQIKELTEGTSVEGIHGLVEKLEVSATKAGKPYLRLTIRDESGSIAGVMWDYSSNGWLKEGVVVEINGDVSSYQGALQMKYAMIMPSDKDPGLFAKRTKFDVETMWSYLVDKVASFQEPLTKYVAEEILLNHPEVTEAFKLAPAARGVHNAWYNGLLEHVWSLCQMGELLVDHYRRNYCPKISRDKVLFGLMIHDAGKIIEYDYKTPAFSTTGLGILANHMVLGPAWVFEAANKWLRSQEAAGGGKAWSTLSAAQFKLERAQLMHLCAAHHGRVEWGSPVQPATLEAILVHHLDNTDAKMMHAMDYVLGKAGPVAGFSEKSFIERVSFMQYPEG
jgi:3'-5' exoribonuclease